MGEREQAPSSPTLPLSHSPVLNTLPISRNRLSLIPKWCAISCRTTRRIIARNSSSERH